jgi:hypothetical protein|eukprot:6365341-Prymnesium_polylepis.1
MIYEITEKIPKHPKSEQNGHRIVCLAQYIALSLATGSVCNAIGNRVELKNIPKLLHKLSGGQFKLVWSASFCARDHIALERLDGTMSFSEMINLLDAGEP